MMMKQIEMLWTGNGPCLSVCYERIRMLDVSVCARVTTENKRRNVEEEEVCAVFCSTVFFGLCVACTRSVYVYCTSVLT